MSYEDTLIREMTDEGQPNHEDACPVCDKIECVCPTETDHGIVLEHPLKKYFPVPDKCDGDHGEPKCSDLGCWLGEPQPIIDLGTFLVFPILLEDRKP